MKQKQIKKIILLALVTGFVANIQAQVSPEIELGARGVMSGNAAVDPSGTTSAVSDFSDSQLLLGFKQKLYNEWRAQMVFGMQFPDADSDLGQVYYNHIFLRIMNQRNEIKIGRSITQTTLNEFSTLRDDDAMQFNYSLNPFSDGRNTQDNQYGNVIEYNHIVKQRYWIKLHGENFVDVSAPDNFDLNAFGFSLKYLVPESQRWNREILQSAGISYNNYMVNGVGRDSDSQLLRSLLGAMTLNLKPDPVHFIDLKFQGIATSGFSGLDSISNYSDYVSTASISTFGTIRYLHRKYERPAFQTSFSFGYKWFPELDQGSQVIGIANMFYRIGENVDLGFQYRYTHNDGAAETLFGSQAHKFQLAMVYSINQVFNNQFDDRESILNLEYSYIK